MKKPLNPTIKWLIVGIVCVAVVALIGVLSSGGDDQVDISSYIRYHANGGGFDNSVDDVKKIGYQTGAFPANIRPSGDQSTQWSGQGVYLSDRTGYQFEGWYLPVLDDNGEIAYEDENKTVVKLGEAFDFTKRLEDGADIDLYAKWTKKEYVSVVLAGSELNIDENTSYKIGDEIKELFFTDGKVQLFKGANLLKTKSKYTFYEYYYDEECTQVVSWPVEQPEGQSVYTIYAKYIEGDWTFVSTKEDVVTMFAQLGTINKGFWLLNDIDMENETVTSSERMNAAIAGNGYTISNLVVQNTQVGDDGAAIFGEMGSNAKIEKLTLTDVTLNMTVKANSVTNLYFLFTQIAEGAQISELRVNGEMKVHCNSGVAINNINEKNHSAWVIGGDQSLLEEKITATVICNVDGTVYTYPEAVDEENPEAEG